MLKQRTKRVNRAYSTEENATILSKIEEAKNQGLDLGIVYQDVADELGDGRTPNGVRLQYYKLKGERKQEGETSSPVFQEVPLSLFKEDSKEEVEVIQAEIVHPVRLTSSEPSTEIVIDRIAQITRERDYYKEQYEKLYAEWKRMERLLGL